MHVHSYPFTFAEHCYVSQQVFTGNNPIPAKRVRNSMARVLIFFMNNVSKIQSKFSDSFTPTVLERSMSTLVCHVNLGLDTVQFLTPRGRSEGAYF